MEDSVYHMTHIENLESILKSGLLSHNKIEDSNIQNHKIYDEDVMSICRSYNGIDLHSYIRFYLNPKNPMLYKRKGIQGLIIILQMKISNLVKCAGNNPIIITDGNAASGYTRSIEYNRMTNNFLDNDCIYGPSWNNYKDGKRIRCAELLLSKECINMTNCSAIYVINENMYNVVYNLLKANNFPNLVCVNDYFYF